MAKQAKQIKQMIKDKQYGDVWDLNDILEGRSFDAVVNELRAKVDELKKVRPKLDNLSIKEFKDIILLKERIYVLFNAIGIYGNIKFYENTSDPDALSLLTTIKQLLTELGNETIFFGIWFMHLDDTKADRFINALERYQYYLKELRKLKPYTKTEEIEKIMSLKSMTGGEAFFSIYEVITNAFQFDFQGKKLSQEEVTSNYRSKNPKVREEAYKTVLGKYSENSTILTELYKNVVIDWHNDGIKIRGYKNPINIRNISNDVDDNAVDALLKVVRKNAGVFSDYFKIKYDIMKRNGEKYPFSRLHLYAPFDAKIPDNYTYDDSKKYMFDTLMKFDKRFNDAAKSIFDAGHVHSHPKQNKRSGAFCQYISTTTAPYIMLNHTDTLKDLFTMVHEFGHGLHGVFAQKQNEFTYHSTMPMSETASIFNEMMLADRLMNESKSNNEKIAILVHLLDNQYGTINRQAFFVIFEVYAHEMIKKGIKKDELDKYYYELLKEQFIGMEIPEIFSHEWNYIPHIHENPFYCYAYAWGNLMTLAFYAMYRKNPKSFVEKYITFLSTGANASAKDMLALFKIDPSDEKFWQSGFEVIKEEIEELKRLTK